MGRLAVALVLWSTLSVDPTTPNNPSTPTRPPAKKKATGGWGWLADPRSAVLLTLATVVVLGGGRRVLTAWKSRELVARLAESDVTVDEIAESGRLGREGLIDLFRILGTVRDPDRRDAAGRALAAIWKADNLIAEEERALVLRGFTADWKARRRYPRGLTVPIPIRVEFGVPFLRDDDREVGPTNLAWSCKILGARRASLEDYSPWETGPGVASFTIDPRDFQANGPHRLVLQARVRTEGLTDPWELELPQIPFQFELDPVLDIGALLTLPDQARGDRIAGAISLETPERLDDAPPRFAPIGPDLVLRDPPVVRVALPLPCDLAHAIEAEFEGVPGRFPAGRAIVAGQGAGGPGSTAEVRLDPTSLNGLDAIDRPGEFRLRAVLTADPQAGWADPEVRSIWPGEIVTDWITVTVVRR